MSTSPNYDELLEELFKDQGTTIPDSKTVRAFIQAHPEQKKEVVDLLTSWLESGISEKNDEFSVSEEDINLVVNRTMSSIQSILDAEKNSILDISADIRRVGLNESSFQSSIGIDKSIFDCLVGRMISPDTVPALFVSSIALTLKRPLDAVRSFFLLPPQIRAASKAKKKPAIKQNSFTSIVQFSTLSEADKQAWISEPVDPELKVRQ